jgi:hypothetical protein
VTGPQHDSETSFTPARRGRLRPGRSAEPEPEYDDADVERGRNAALLGALGRMQLRLDVLAREQAEGLRRIEDRLTALEQHLGALAVTPPADDPVTRGRHSL